MNDRREYCFGDFNNANPMRDMMAGHNTTTERLRLACDTRIPANAKGYVVQLCSDSASRAVQLDAARQLSRFVEFYGGVPNA